MCAIPFGFKVPIDTFYFWEQLRWVVPVGILAEWSFYLGGKSLWILCANHLYRSRLVSENTNEISNFLLVPMTDNVTVSLVV